MNKIIGNFEISCTQGGYPVRVEIKQVDSGNCIVFEHSDLADFEHAISEAKKYAIKELPGRFKGEI